MVMGNIESKLIYYEAMSYCCYEHYLAALKRAKKNYNAAAGSVVDYNRLFTIDKIKASDNPIS